MSLQDVKEKTGVITNNFYSVQTREAVSPKVIVRKKRDNFSVDNTTKNIMITGGTGLLGSHIIYEILENNLENLSDIKIINLVHEGSEDKIKEVFRSDLLYPNTSKIGLDKIRSSIVNTTFDVTKPYCGITNEVFKKMKGLKITDLYHVAALTDFRNSDAVKQRLEKINIEGTKNLLDLCQILDVKNIHYISTSYACGKTDGVIPPNFNNKTNIFHNNYEETKKITEKIIKDFCDDKGINYMIYRISGISGRLIYEPIGYTKKYAIFYAWLNYFYKIRKRAGLTPDQTLFLKIRLHIDEMTGINICPVDYGAKLIFNVSTNSNFANKKHIHVVCNNNYNHREMAKQMFDFLNIKGYVFVDSKPDESTMNDMERLYYKFIGEIFHGYMNEGEMVFDTSNLESHFSDILKLCPVMDYNNYHKLIDYAVKNEFS